ncbi:hypothetical protein [Acinetobacter oleivorans]|uniref:hypothetical protein n=1 Tax=Acinetobacter oleivorans TaxID=1148157 RepID=UPI001CEFD16B|nr:hypothetical protein [Acinetobacter oleivorans]
MNNNDIDHARNELFFMGFPSDHQEDKTNNEKIPYIIEQLGIYERYILDRYSHQKRNYIDPISIDPNHIVSNVNNEALKYEYLYDKGEHTRVITPYDDYLYLRDELIKNPFEIGKMPEELLLSYLFCLCKDTREILWNGDIQACLSQIEKIEKVNKLLQGLLKNASYLLFSPEDCGITNREMMYFYPLGQQARYVADPDFGEDMIELFNKNKSSQLNEWHRTLFINVIRETSSKKNKKWKSINAIVTDPMVKKQFHEIMKEQPKQNLDYALAGRRDYKQLYSQAKERLQQELKKNAWLNSYASNTERRSYAQERLEHLDMLITEQETLEKNFKLGKYTFIKRNSYSNDATREWIENDEDFIKEFIQA